MCNLQNCNADEIKQTLPKKEGGENPKWEKEENPLLLLPYKGMNQFFFSRSYQFSSITSPPDSIIVRCLKMLP